MYFCFVVLLYLLVVFHGAWFVCLLRVRLSSFVVVRFIVVVVGAAVPEGLLVVIVVVTAVLVKTPRCVCFAIDVVVVMLSLVVSIVVVMYVGVIACVC